jgi:tRNA nucleotidyltransferase/poly(A) polymerase
MDMFTMFEVGGIVRDELLGIPSKDVDFVAVPSEQLLSKVTETEEMFRMLSKHLVDSGYDIKVETPDCYTIRALFPKEHKYKGVADVVLARKECGYVSGTRRPIIKPGSLYDDLLRRDFTLNAMAKNGNYN